MRLTHLTLHNFRCFERFELEFNESMVLIEGPNGVGKSSIAEALYYAGYLRSFRTHRAEDIAFHEANHFFIELKGMTRDGDLFTITVGVEDGNKKIKVNHTAIQTYKELMDYYQVVMVSEHDMRLIQEGPEERRTWINQLCILQSPELVETLRLYKNIMSQRLQLLMQHQGHTEHYMLWSQQLWEISKILRNSRYTSLQLLEQEIARLIVEYSITMPPITFHYKPRGGREETFALFWQQFQTHHLQTEITQRRAGFGAHLDDIVINWGGKNARLYASRGQQKLILLLIKCAMVRLLQKSTGATQPTLLFILDDFITDLDDGIAATVMRVIQGLRCNSMITCPLENVVHIEGKHQRIMLPIL